MTATEVQKEPMRVASFLSRVARPGIGAVLAAALALGLAEPAEALQPTEVFARAAPSVVVVQARLAGDAMSSGSGVAVWPDVVATNCHVVKGATKVQVSQNGGQLRFPAALVESNEQLDVCLLRAEGANFRPAAVAERKSIRIGDRAYAIGAPRGLELTITEGLVSGIRGVDGGELIQTSVAISPGSSGGGLFNEAAELIGLTTSAYKDSQNLNFAVPGSAVMALMRRHNAAESAQILRGAARTAQPSDEPREAHFTDAEHRMAYLRWLALLSQRLAQFDPDAKSRNAFLSTLWYESKRAGLEPALVLGIIEVSSGFRKDAINEAGARGYMQVAPMWSAIIGDGDTAKLFFLQTNLRYGCVVLRHYLDEANGNLELALTRYYLQSQGTPLLNESPQARAFVSAVLATRKKWLIADVQPPSAKQR